MAARLVSQRPLPPQGVDVVWSPLCEFVLCAQTLCSILTARSSNGSAKGTHESRSNSSLPYHPQHKPVQRQFKCIGSVVRTVAVTQVSFSGLGQTISGRARFGGSTHTQDCPQQSLKHRNLTASVPTTKACIYSTNRGIRYTAGDQEGLRGLGDPQN